MQKIYLASSWKNKMMVNGLAHILRATNQFEIYDFTENHGFHWSEIDETYQQWGWSRYKEQLNDPRSVEGFVADFDNLRDCDICILILPCNRSAHLELGYAVGTNKRTAILTDDSPQASPELMYKMVDHIALNTGDLLEWLGVPNE